MFQISFNLEIHFNHVGKTYLLFYSNLGVHWKECFTIYRCPQFLTNYEVRKRKQHIGQAISCEQGAVAEWIRWLTQDRKVLSSNPTNFVFCSIDRFKLIN